MKFFCKLVSLFSFLFSFSVLAQENQESLKKWAYDSIHIPLNKDVRLKNKPIIVAVIDDGFNINHKAIKDFIYKNPYEKNNNSIDEDENGYIDDISGWDISDNDNDVSVPDKQKNYFYHGTYIASIITKIASLHFKSIASERIKIMPIKVLQDKANSTYIKDGYKGIKYAIDNGANVICLAWSGGNPSVEEIQVIKEANDKGILMIASAGNFNEEKVLFPSAFSDIISVAGVNRHYEKEQNSNYGMEVTISAPGEEVFGAHAVKENAYFFDSGTSPATGIVAGCAAILLSKSYVTNMLDVKEAIVNASTLFEVNKNRYKGKMGAGIINLEKAIEYSLQKVKKNTHFSSKRTRGYITFNDMTSREELSMNLGDGFYGVYIKPNLSNIKNQEKYSIAISINDTLWNSYNLAELPSNLFVPSPSLKLSFEKHIKKKDVVKLEYYGKPIDSTKMFCQDELTYIYKESGNGVLDDGSAFNNYSNNCSCRWIITAPVDKKIKFVFEFIDTEPNVDFVYLINGQTAIPDRIFAKFSGNNMPPIVFSLSNEVLIWFVTDSQKNGKGWRFNYEIID